MKPDQDRLIKLLLIVTYTFIAGIVYAVFFPLFPEEMSGLWGAVGGSVLIGGVGAYVLHVVGWRKTLFVFGIIGLIAFLVGWGRYSMALDHLYPNSLDEHLSDGFDDPRTVEGTVVEAPEVTEDGEVTLTVEPERIRYEEEGEPHPVDRGQLLLRIQSYQDHDLSFSEAADNSIYADRLRFTGPISEPMPRTNPHGFDYQQFLHNQGIYGAMWFATDVERLEENTGNRMVAWALGLQTEMLTVIKQTMPYPYSAFLGGATLGLREGLDFTLSPFQTGEIPEYVRSHEENFLKNLVNEEFRGAGTMHVLAVSGLHVGVLAGAFWALFAGLRLPKKIYAPLIVVLLLIFTILTGARPSTQRAFIMTALILIVFAYSERGLKNSAMVGLSAAALVILLIQPQLVFEASFTLSFTAVLCLVLLSGPVDRVLQKLRGLSFLLFWVVAAVTTYLLMAHWNWFLQPVVYLPYLGFWGATFWWAFDVDRRHRIAGGIGFLDIPASLRNFIGLQFAVQLGMMWPLSAYYFLEYPFAGIYANLLAIPLVGIVVPLGLFAGLMGLIPVVGHWLALLLNAGNFLAVWLFMWVSHFSFELFPYPAVREFTLWHLLVFYGALGLFIAWRPSLEGFKRFWGQFLGRPLTSPAKTFVAVLSVAGVILYGSFWFIESPPEEVRLTALNVGYGSAVAVQAPGGTNMLLNAGARQWDWHHRDNLPDRRDQGRLAVSDFFLRQGIKELDLLGLQSIEPQRLGGMGYMANHFVVRAAIGPLPEDRLGSSPSLDDFTAAIGDSYLEENQEAQWFRFDYFHNWKRMWEPLRRQETEYYRPREGDVVWDETLTIDGQEVPFRITALNPPESSPHTFRVAENESVVLMVEIGETRILLPGDIREDAQNWMLDRYGAGQLEADVLFVPSNGTASESYYEPFYDAVDPEFVVLSTADRIDIRGPQGEDMEEQITATWEALSERYDDGQLFRTDRDHAIIVRSDGDELSITPFVETENGMVTEQEGEAFDARL